MVPEQPSTSQSAVVYHTGGISGISPAEIYEKH